jgi:chromosome segregation ATPase
MKISSELRELFTDKEKKYQIMLSYRRDEIVDLIQTVNKRLESSDADQFNTQQKDLNTTELTTKRNRLQDELNSIEEQLFELEKKYGEIKSRHGRAKDLKPEVNQDDDAQDEKVETNEAQEVPNEPENV